MKELISEFTREAYKLFPAEYSVGSVSVFRAWWYTAAGRYLESKGDPAAFLVDDSFDSLEGLHDCVTALAPWLIQYDLDPNPLIDVDEAIMGHASGNESFTLQYLAGRLLRLDVLHKQTLNLAEKPAEVMGEFNLNATETDICDAINLLWQDGIDWPETPAIAKKAGFPEQTIRNNTAPMARHGILEKGPSDRSW